MSVPRSITVFLVTALAASGAAMLGSQPAIAGTFTLSSSFGAPGSEPGQFATPAGIAVEQSTGDVFVADLGNKRVEDFNPEGTEVLSVIDGSETPQKEFQSGLGVAVDSDPSSVSYQDVYVSAAGAGVVDKFKPKTPGSHEYEYVCQLTGPGGGCYPNPQLEGKASTEPFVEPVGVTVDSQGDLYVGASNVVYEFNASGGDVSPPLASAELTEPFSVAVDSDGDVYATRLGRYAVKFSGARAFEGVLDEREPTVVAADPSSGDVYVVDTEGGDHISEYEAGGKTLGEAKLIETFGAKEFGEATPFGIAYSTFNGDVYVTDDATNEIKIFAKTSFRITGSFGAPGGAVGQFATPAGIAVEQSTGDVFVADLGNKRVEDFNPEGTEVLSVIDGSETPQKEFQSGLGVAVDSDPSSVSYQDVYVSAAGAGVVDKFKPKTPGSHEYEYVCQLTGPGGGCYPNPQLEGKASTEPFVEPVGVTVDSQGDLYVGASNVVYEFNASGGDVSPPLASAELTEPFSVAVDSDGDVYATRLGRYAVKFSGARAFEGVLDEREPTVVAADPSSGDVYVVDTEGGDHISEYEAGGKTLGEAKLIETFGAKEFGEATPFGIAYSTFNGDVYVTDDATNEIKIFANGAIKLPVPSQCQAIAVTATSATLTAKLNAEHEVGVHWHFEWGETKAYGALTSEEELAGGVSTVEAGISGLDPNTAYHCQLLAYDAHDKAKPAEGGDGEFRTTMIAPKLESESASFISSSTAVLVAQIDPEHSATRFHFEYGPNTSYGLETPEESAGNGVGPLYVSQRIEGLLPGTTYYFRVVATNEGEMIVRGPAEQLTTKPRGEPPTVMTGVASSIVQGGATVSGTVRPRRLRDKLPTGDRDDNRVWHADCGISRLGNGTGIAVDPVAEPR